MYIYICTYISIEFNCVYTLCGLFVCYFSHTSHWSCQTKRNKTEKYARSVKRWRWFRSSGSSVSGLEISAGACYTFRHSNHCLTRHHAQLLRPPPTPSPNKTKKKTNKKKRISMNFVFGWRVRQPPLDLRSKEGSARQCYTLVSMKHYVYPVIIVKLKSEITYTPGGLLVLFASCVCSLQGSGEFSSENWKLLSRFVRLSESIVMNGNNPLWLERHCEHWHPAVIWHKQQHPLVVKRGSYNGIIHAGSNSWSAFTRHLSVTFNKTSVKNTIYSKGKDQA